MRPRLLGAEKSAAAGDPLRTLADWIADPANPYFAKAQANRVWFHLFGRGLVEPNDDFRASNPAVNGPLLDELAKRFAASGFDLKSLVKVIVSSRAYQLA